MGTSYRHRTHATSTLPTHVLGTLEPGIVPDKVYQTGPGRDLGPDDVHHTVDCEPDGAAGVRE
jgi:hypothetical protein